MLTINMPMIDLAKKSKSYHALGQLPGCSQGLIIAQILQQHAGTVLIITSDMTRAQQISDECRFFIDLPIRKQLGNIQIFPDWETLPYDALSPHRDIVSKRLEILSQLPQSTRDILIVPINTLIQKISPKEYLTQYSLSIKAKQILNLENFRQQLQQAGYHHTSQVMEHGEYTFRGSIIDLYPMGSRFPYRIDLLDNEIDSIRTFDPETQRSIEKIEKINLLPAHEFPLTQSAIELFQAQWTNYFTSNPYQSIIFQNTLEGQYTPGLEYYLPLFFKTTSHLMEYLPENTLIIYEKNIQKEIEKFQQELHERFEQLRHDHTRPILPPSELFLSTADFFTSLNNFSKISLQNEPISEDTGRYNFLIHSVPDIFKNQNYKKSLQPIAEFLLNFSGRILFCVESLGRQEILLTLLKNINFEPIKINSWENFLNLKEKYGIIIAPLTCGVHLTESNILIITENELFGEQVSQRRFKKISAQETETIIKNLEELKVGDPVVHLQHGVGRFLGLQTLNVNEKIDDYLTLEYLNHDKLYVPITSLHLISRYSGQQPDQAPWHALGTPHWEKAKEKASKRIHDTATELLEIYARRSAASGFAFKKSMQDYFEFSQTFPFDETIDQEKAITDTINDMEKSQPMDRLVCGDVGFGKTEVAIRAAFIAVQNNKQVAILVPTTLLAQQHYQTFLDRFAGWPMTIEMLSRFRSVKTQNEIIEKLQHGKIDIIIATHKLLQKNINFKNLGLLIIDEEHRFGVRQKEQLKKMRAEVDILTLTATPIPRTLNMSFAGIRDLSIIATPPKRRLSIKTFLLEKQKHVIREAILREIHRGGQVYYLYNNVMNIEKITEDLKQLIPEAKINFAHGQMREIELEKIMNDFYHHRFNVLVCTTIIESGIDIPSANTMIIERADKFGLAQLHQLRGRVGRSHHQAYAYLLIPSAKLLTSDAKKRLAAIESLDELGIGFSLATHDMEIRGAGELLGEKQSGDIQEIGFHLYMEMLAHTIKLLKSGKLPSDQLQEEFKTEMNLPINAIIPETYIPEPPIRLVLYKRIASATKTDELDDLRVEMIDRFGLLPEATKNLFQLTELKIKATSLGIKKIDANAKMGYMEFIDKPAIDPEKVLQLIQQEPNRYRLTGSNRLRFNIEKNDLIEQINKLLERLLTF